MLNISTNSKLIAKNTIILYFRMIVMVVISFFTSRIILNSLGIEDYGIYNVVGGFVSIFSVVNSGLVAATQRFLTIDLGKGNVKELNKTFSTLIFIYIFISIFAFVIAELCGIWFIENKLNVVYERRIAAFWVFHSSIIILVLSLVTNPFKALIIAHEKMNAFAFITIFEVIAKLVVSYSLYVFKGDKLILYAILMCGVQTVTPLLFAFYCKLNFKEEINIMLHIDFYKVKEIYGFAGWTMLGSFAYMGFTQGLNILLGLFFNPSVNAARGVAVQVQGTINKFVINFQTAIDPQIFKTYAKNDIQYLLKLVSTSARCSFFLLYFISFPIYFEANRLLSIWLVEVPPLTSIFLKLIIITSLFDSITNPFAKAVQASGNIKYYSICGSGILLLIVPFAYVVLKLGGSPQSVFIVHLFFGSIALIQRITMAKKVLHFNYKDIISSIFVPILIVFIYSMLTLFLLDLLNSYNELPVVINCIIIYISVSLIIYFKGITIEERKIIKKTLFKYVKTSNN